MSLLASLRASLSLETAQFEAGARRAQRTARTTAGSINKSLGSIKAIGSGFFAAFTVGALSTGIKAALDYAGSLGELSQQLGVTTRDLQTLRYAAGQVGVDQATLETGLMKLTVTLGKVAAGAKEPTKALAAIGITAKEVAGLSTGDAFRKIADGLSQIGDRSQRAAVEVALFGKSGAKLDTMLSGGSKALNELALAADKLGMVLSDEQIQKADDTADKLAAVKTVLAANIAGVVADNASAIVGLASSLGQLTSAVVKFLNSNPQLALGIIGALAGGRIGGAYGAVIGGGIGVAAGVSYKRSQELGVNDLKTRKAALNKAQAEYAAAKKIPGRGGAIATSETRKRLMQETDATNRAVAAFWAKKNSGGGAMPTGSVGDFLAGGGGRKGGKGKDTAAEAERLRKQQLRDAYQFSQDMRRSDIDVLQAKRDLAVNTEQRTELSLQILAKEREGDLAEIEYQVATGELTAAQGEALKLKKEEVARLQEDAIRQEAAAQKRDDEDQLIQTRYSIERDALQARRDLATSSAERRQIELELLDMAYAEKRQILERQIANEQLTAAVRARAQAELNALPNQFALDKQGVMQSTRGPWEQWQSDAMNTADAMEQLKVQGIEGAVNALAGLTEGFQNFRQMAVSAIKDIIAQLIRMQLMKMAASIFSGGASPQMLGAHEAAFLPGFATGGSFTLGGNHGRDRNMMSLNGVPIARVSRGERVSISNDNPGRGGMIHAPMSFSFSGPVTRETQMQVAASARKGINQATRKGI